MKKITIIGLGGMGSNFITFVNKYLKKDISNIEINTLLVNPKELDKDFIENNVQKDEQIFVVLGLGGSSSNVLIELIDILKETNIKPYLIVLKPFVYESKERTKLANSTIEKLNNLDNLKIFENNLDKIHDSKLVGVIEDVKIDSKVIAFLNCVNFYKDKKGPNIICYS